MSNHQNAGIIKYGESCYLKTHQIYLNVSFDQLSNLNIKAFLDKDVEMAAPKKLIVSSGHRLLRLIYDKPSLIEYRIPQQISSSLSKNPEHILLPNANIHIYGISDNELDMHRTKRISKEDFDKAHNEFIESYPDQPKEFQVAIMRIKEPLGRYN